MISKLLELVTGKDDLERVAEAGDVGRLNAYLGSRSVLIPKRPTRFLEPGALTPEDLKELLEEELMGLNGNQFELWILEVGGRKRLPVFSSPKKVEAFTARMTKELNRVFPVGYVEVLLGTITRQAEVDFVDVNLFSSKSWEIDLRRHQPPVARAA